MFEKVDRYTSQATGALEDEVIRQTIKSLDEAEMPQISTNQRTREIFTGHCINVQC